MNPEDYGYVVKNNLCLFQKGPLSNWWLADMEFPIAFFLSSNYMFQHNNIKYFKLNDTPDRYWENLTWNCVEQWMMAAKALLFDDPETYELIRSESSPKEQKALGRKVKNFNAGIWQLHAPRLIYRAIEMKFTQNLELEHFISQFHPSTIFVEAAPWDKIWGIGMGPNDPDALDINKWQGENLLGSLITMFRMNQKWGILI